MADSEHFDWSQAEVDRTADGRGYTLDLPHDLPEHALADFRQSLAQWVRDEQPGLQLVAASARTPVANERYSGRLKLVGRDLLSMSATALRDGLERLAGTAYNTDRDEDDADKARIDAWLTELRRG